MRALAAIVILAIAGPSWAVGGQQLCPCNTEVAAGDTPPAVYPVPSVDAAWPVVTFGLGGLPYGSGFGYLLCPSALFGGAGSVTPAVQAACLDPSKQGGPPFPPRSGCGPLAITAFEAAKPSLNMTWSLGAGCTLSVAQRMRLDAPSPWTSVVKSGDSVALRYQATLCQLWAGLSGSVQSACAPVTFALSFMLVVTARIGVEVSWVECSTNATSATRWSASCAVKQWISAGGQFANVATTPAGLPPDCSYSFPQGSTVLGFDCPVERSAFSVTVLFQTWRGERVTVAMNVTRQVSAVSASASGALVPPTITMPQQHVAAKQQVVLALSGGPWKLLGMWAKIFNCPWCVLSDFRTRPGCDVAGLPSNASATQVSFTAASCIPLGQQSGLLEIEMTLQFAGARRQSADVMQSTMLLRFNADGSMSTVAGGGAETGAAPGDTPPQSTPAPTPTSVLAIALGVTGGVVGVVLIAGIAVAIVLRWRRDSTSEPAQ